MQRKKGKNGRKKGTITKVPQLFLKESGSCKLSNMSKIADIPGWRPGELKTAFCYLFF